MICMGIEPDGLLPGRQCAAGSVNLCLHQQGWNGENTGADCACSMGKSIDRLMSRSPMGPVRGMVARVLHQ